MPQKIHYFKLSDPYLREFETAIHLMEFKSKGAYFTACAQAALFGETETPLDPATNTWIRKRRTILIHKRTIIEPLLNILDTIAIPVIANKGIDVLIAQKEVLRTMLHDQTGEQISDADLIYTITLFETLNKDKIYQHKTRQNQP